jgi:hypothetical protein
MFHTSLAVSRMVPRSVVSRQAPKNNKMKDAQSHTWRRFLPGPALQTRPKQTSGKKTKE